MNFRLNKVEKNTLCWIYRNKMLVITMKLKYLISKCIILEVMNKLSQIGNIYAMKTINKYKIVFRTTILNKTILANYSK
jgi:hypothetical protein